MIPRAFERAWTREEAVMEKWKLFGFLRWQLERTIEFARATSEFDWKKLPKTLRVAIDSSPLEGAG
ncbi:MAG: hypothetical protein WCK73_14970, partial [Deltaproteobacteria bacterium]